MLRNPPSTCAWVTPWPRLRTTRGTSSDWGQKASTVPATQPEGRGDADT